MHVDSTGLHHKRSPRAIQVYFSLGIFVVYFVNKRIDLLGAWFMIIVISYSLSQLVLLIFHEPVYVFSVCTC